ncbi:recombinase RecT [Pantoea sp. Al-1710]|uniref:Recombinase RecT n=1 Tax=Candidatus Pantoea communis TaxID=2608354 RepID=A0ABX0RLX1_9GAMM|nr:RecT family recombinase [Pantoea communis]NIG17478.1 recombinase RecT [Pantoea communis]
MSNDLIHAPTNEADTRAAIFSPTGLQKLQAFADVMAKGKATVPAHLAGSPADCMAVALQAAQWGMNPYAVAQKTHLINGVLGYEAQLVNAVITSMAPTKDRLHYDWFGPWEKVIGKFIEKTSQKGNKYIAPNWSMADEQGCGVRVWATLKGEDEPRVLELLLSQAQVRNSTLWGSDPKQQLAYLGVKRWARLYCPDVILGVYTPDEFEPQQRAERDVTPARSRADLNNLINNKPETQQPEREINPATSTNDAPRTPDQLLADFTEASANADSVSSLDRFYKYAAKVLADSTGHLEKATDVYLIRKAELDEAGA